MSLAQVGDYWVIYLLSKNLNPVAMKELMEELRPVMVTPAKAYPLLGAEEEDSGPM